MLSHICIYFNVSIDVCKFTLDYHCFDQVPNDSSAAGFYGSKTQWVSDISVRAIIREMRGSGRLQSEESGGRLQTSGCQVCIDVQ